MRHSDIRDDLPPKAGLNLPFRLEVAGGGAALGEVLLVVFLDAVKRAGGLDCGTMTKRGLG